MTTLLKIPKGLASAVVRKRVVCGQYTTAKPDVPVLGLNGKPTNKGKAYKVNSELNLVGTFCVLKTVTTSGCITTTDPDSDIMFNLAELCKISKSLLYNRFGQLKKMGLLKWCKSSHTIRLASWDKLREMYAINSPENIFYVTDYDHDQKQIKPQYIIILLEYFEAAKRMDYGFAKSWAENPDKHSLINQMEILLKADRKRIEDNDMEYIKSQLRQWQVMVFAQIGSNGKDTSEIPNPIIERSIKTVRETFDFKSKLSVYDMEKMLCKAGLITKHVPSPITSTKCSHKAKNIAYTHFLPATKENPNLTIWYQTRQITPNLNFGTC